MMIVVTIDFETYSEVPIEVGTTKYTMNCIPLCMAYKVNDEPTEIWLKDEPFPIEVLEKADYIIAHNAYFEYCVLENRGYNIPLSRFIDTAAIARRCSLLPKLKDAAAIMCTEQKDEAGKALIKKCCTPEGRPTIEDFNNLYAYCKQDVEATYDLWKSLPIQRLSREEKKIWLLTARMNRRGLPVDRAEIKAIYTYTEMWKNEMGTLVPEITDGKIQTVNQVQKMKEYLGLPNLKAETVTKTLARDDLPEDKRQLLELRQALGRSSTAKYKKLLETEFNGYVYDNHIYYGSMTGRFAGANFQLLNLPRAQAKDPDALIRKFMNIEDIDNPVIAAKSLIRSMIKAPSGQMLYDADYSSIEYVMLIWSANDQDALYTYTSGQDPYKHMAAFLYEKPYDKITHEERQVGKVVILGCGYMMGHKTLRMSAKGFGVELTNSQAATAVRAFRKLYEKVTIFWQNLQQAFYIALRDKMSIRVNDYYKVSYTPTDNGKVQSWLSFQLPSKRSIIYPQPRFKNSRIVHYGRHPKTKQWAEITLSPMRMVENAIQGIARDIMCHGLQKVEEYTKIKPIGCIHDEALGIGPNTNCDIHLKAFTSALCALPDWAKDVPLKAEGWYGERFRK